MTAPRRRILLVITRADEIGGAHMHVITLGSHLRDQGHDVLVAAGQPEDGPYVDLVRQSGLPLVTLDHLARPVRLHSDARAFIEMRSLFASLEPDIVHLHSSKAGVLGRLAAAQLGIPAVFTAHGWSFTPGVPQPYRFVWRGVERYVTRTTPAHVITVAEADRRLALSQCVGSESQITTVHNGLPDVSPEQRAVSQRARPTFIMVARFDVQKDHETLVDALRHLSDIDIHLRMVGTGPTEHRVRQRVNDLTGHSVEFLGQRDDVDELLSQSSVLLLPSRWEGLPICIIEAMRAGIPAVATNVGGVEELVSEEETGYLVAPGDSRTLAEHMRTLAGDSTIRERMGRAARAKYESNFTVECMAAATESVYKRVVCSS